MNEQQIRKNLHSFLLCCIRRVCLFLFLGRALSSAGRAAALQAVGHKFDPCSAHHFEYGVVVKLVITPACHAGGREFESRHSRHFARIVLLYAAQTVQARAVAAVCQAVGAAQNGGNIFRTIWPEVGKTPARPLTLGCSTARASHYRRKRCGCREGSTDLGLPTRSGPS